MAGTSAVAFRLRLLDKGRVAGPIVLGKNRVAGWCRQHNAPPKIGAQKCDRVPLDKSEGVVKAQNSRAVFCHRLGGADNSPAPS